MNGGSTHSKSSSWSGMYFPGSGAATPSTSTPNGGASPDRAMSAGISTHDANTSIFGDAMFHLQPYTPHTPTAADPTHGSGMLLDFSSLTGLNSSPSSGQHVDLLSAAVTQFSTPGADYATPWAMEPLYGGGATTTTSNTTAASSSSDGAGPPVSAASATADMAAYLATPTSSLVGEHYACSCHAGVTELLTSMRGSGGDDRRRLLPVDAQLAKLRRCVASSESSMACVHGRDDAEPIHIMAVATLIGYVIDEFEMLACETMVPLRRGGGGRSGHPTPADVAEGCGGGGGGLSVSGSDEQHMNSSMVTPAAAAAAGANNMPLVGFLEPRLSWGVLEFEDDDEAELRQRLYLLSFRRLERLLSQLTMYLRALHDARAGLAGDASRHMAFVMACDYTRLWLEKKAEDVKRLLSVSVGDDMMDPALA
ncbi:hypothetical protein Daus18300_012245 [Diaporthe australafricana]|uniref:Transcription factor n=1 Tax=Diaporthe australafricana TaxID=127596 RepID=A0ABR3W3J7_9PEZI